MSALSTIPIRPTPTPPEDFRGVGVVVIGLLGAIGVDEKVLRGFVKWGWVEQMLAAKEILNMSNHCKRPDLSTFLIHLTKGDSDEVAFDNLKSIIRNKTLFQSSYLVGGKNVVCFTETPVGCLKTADGLRNYTDFQKYSRFGIMVYKQDVHSDGGRPVLYLEDKYKNQLPEEIKWRHQKFEPSFTSIKYDWTWEREWRMIGHFKFNHRYYEAIVPSIEYANRLKSELGEEQVMMYEECQNNQIEIMSFNELCDPDCEIEISDNCPPPEDFEKMVICLDGTC